jgi:hypothetical protein
MLCRAAAPRLVVAGPLLRRQGRTEGLPQCLSGPAQLCGPLWQPVRSGHPGQALQAFGHQISGTDVAAESEALRVQGHRPRVLALLMCRHSEVEE